MVVYSRQVPDNCCVSLSDENCHIQTEKKKTFPSLLLNYWASFAWEHFFPFVLVQCCSVTCDQSKNVYFVLRSFHFHDLRVDEALRSFLESFRLPGESPVIEHIMEFFSKQFYVSGNTFTCVITHIHCWILFTCMTSSCNTIDDFFHLKVRVLF